MPLEMGKLVADVVVRVVEGERVAVVKDEVVTFNVVVTSFPSSPLVVVTLAVSVATGLVTVVSLALD